jgi:hypothetical protein
MVIRASILRSSREKGGGVPMLGEWTATITKKAKEAEPSRF